MGAGLRICTASAGVSEIQGDALKDGFHSYLGCDRDTDDWFAGRSFSTGEVDQPASNFMRSLVVSSNGAFSLWDINIADTAALMTTEEWMHVVISVSPTAIVTYIDGQQMPDDAYILYGHNGAAHTDANSAYQVPSDLKYGGHDIVAFDSQPIILGARTTLDREFLGAMAGFTVWDGPANTAAVSSVYAAQRPVVDAFEPFGPRIIVGTPVILESSLTTGGGLATGAETVPEMIGNAVVANRAVISWWKNLVPSDSSPESLVMTSNPRALEKELNCTGEPRSLITACCWTPLGRPPLLMHHRTARTLPSRTAGGSARMPAAVMSTRTATVGSTWCPTARRTVAIRSKVPPSAPPCPPPPTQLD